MHLQTEAELSILGLNESKHYYCRYHPDNYFTWNLSGLASG